MIFIYDSIAYFEFVLDFVRISTLKYYEIIQTLLLAPFLSRFSERHTESYASQVHRFSVNRNADS